MQTHYLLAPANWTSTTSVALSLICVKFCIPNEDHAVTAVLIFYKASLKLDSAHFICEYMRNFTSVLNWEWRGSGSLFVRDRKGGTSG